MPAPPFPAPIKYSGGRGRDERDGLAYRPADIDRWVVAGGPAWSFIGKHKFNDSEKGSYMSEVVEAYDNARKLIDDANVAYNKTLQSFRSTIRNDLSSIASSADKVQAEVGRMQRSYQAAVDTLTSPSMEAAIANAERLATALRAVSELQSHSITFAVLDKKSA